MSSRNPWFSSVRTNSLNRKVSSTFLQSTATRATRVCPRRAGPPPPETRRPVFDHNNLRPPISLYPQQPTAHPDPAPTPPPATVKAGAAGTPPTSCHVSHKSRPIAAMRNTLPVRAPPGPARAASHNPCRTSHLATKLGSFRQFPTCSRPQAPGPGPANEASLTAAPPYSTAAPPPCRSARLRGQGQSPQPASRSAGAFSTTIWWSAGGTPAALARGPHPGHRSLQQRLQPRRHRLPMGADISFHKSFHVF